MEKLSSGEKRDTVAPAGALCVTLSAFGPTPPIGKRRGEKEKQRGWLFEKTSGFLVWQESVGI